MISGFGNNGKDGLEGVRRDNLIGTYLHGPLLPKNAWLADRLIALALERRYGSPPALEPLDDEPRARRRGVRPRPPLCVAECRCSHPGSLGRWDDCRDRRSASWSRSPPGRRPPPPAIPPQVAAPSCAEGPRRSATRPSARPATTSIRAPPGVATVKGGGGERHDRRRADRGRRRMPRRLSPRRRQPDLRRRAGRRRRLRRARQRHPQRRRRQRPPLRRDRRRPAARRARRRPALGRLRRRLDRRRSGQRLRPRRRDDRRDRRHRRRHRHAQLRDRGHARLLRQTGEPTRTSAPTRTSRRRATGRGVYIDLADRHRATTASPRTAAASTKKSKGRASRR